MNAMLRKDKAGEERLGEIGCGLQRQDAAGKVRLGAECRELDGMGESRHGRYGVTGHGWKGESWQARQVWRGRWVW